MIHKFSKDPNAILDYKWDWTKWLAQNESIDTFTVTVINGTTLIVDSQSNTNSTVTAWLSGGSKKFTYEVTCHITTNQGRTDDRTIYILCEDR